MDFAIDQEIKAFQNSLPIYEYKEEIIELIKCSDFSIITGETGSGKSTQLPQYILDSSEIAEVIHNCANKVENNKDDDEKEETIKKLKIVVTQPRRMATISMAKRICYERQEELGEEIGYAIRFDDKTSSKTVLRYETDGILVKECLHDHLLSKYDVVILDEAHERSVYTDILFALVKEAVIMRKGTLKLVITSATLNTTQFSNYFNKCPILSVRGKSYPVDIKYGTCISSRRVEESVKSAIRMHLHEGPGDILVFLTGSEECEFAAKLCIMRLEELISKGKSVPAMMIFALYGAQSSEDQGQVFLRAPENTRKVFLTYSAYFRYKYRRDISDN